MVPCWKNSSRELQKRESLYFDKISIIIFHFGIFSPSWKNCCLCKNDRISSPSYGYKPELIHWMNNSSQKLWRNMELNIGKNQKLSLLIHFGLSGSLIFPSISPPQVHRFREPLKLTLVTEASKQLLRFLMFLVDQKDLWLLIETSKRRRNKLSVNNLMFWT